MTTFAETVRSLTGIALTAAQLRDFDRFEEILLEQNRQFNLTAIRDRAEIRIKHFADSLSCLKVIRPRTGMRVIDVGTGAGFPGIPLKIAAPELRLTLVEATGKKAEFCRLVADQLKLRDVEVLHARAEEVGQDPARREKYDWAAARAVADLSILAEYLLPLTKVGGRAVAQKGAAGPAEGQSAAEALHLLGGAISKIECVELPGVVEPRYLIVLDKVAATPPMYPRRTGVPSKKPLGS
jgi:16S rRNA (guanine527-N7)-methyltransferase